MQLVFQAIDLTDDVGFRKFVVAAAKVMRRLDGVAHCCASVAQGLANGLAYHDSHTPRLHELTRTRFDEIVTANQAATFSVLQAALRHFVAQDQAKAIPPAGGYSIVIVGSVISASSDTSPVYAAASRFVQSLSTSVARDYGKDDVRCNVVNVGPLEVPMVDGLLRGIDFSRIPLGRGVKPAEVAEPIAMLLGPAAAYITGSIVAVDGGASSTV